VQVRGARPFRRARVVIAAYSVRIGEEPCDSDVPDQLVPAGQA
jgi:hypothetical protein